MKFWFVALRSKQLFNSTAPNIGSRSLKRLRLVKSCVTRFHRECGVQKISARVMLTTLSGFINWGKFNLSFLKSKSFYLGALTAALVSTAAVSIASDGFNPKPLPFAEAPESLQADFGSQQAISEVKVAIVDKFEALQSLAQLSPITQKEIGLANDSEASRSLMSKLEEIWEVDKAKQAHSELVALYAAEAGKFPPPAWTSVSVVVEKWQGVQVNGTEATALFESHTEYSNERSSWSDSAVQWKVTMKFDQTSSEWKLLSRTGVRIEN